MAASANLTTSCLVGSIHYLSPELCDGGQATAAADCWAMGASWTLKRPGNSTESPQKPDKIHRKRMKSIETHRIPDASKLFQPLFFSRSSIFEVVLYEMCTLELPFPGSNALAVCLRILQAVVPPLARSYSKELRALIGALLCPTVEHRISAKQVLGPRAV